MAKKQSEQEDKRAIGEHWSKPNCWGFKYENRADGNIKLWPDMANRANEALERSDALDQLEENTRQYIVSERQKVAAQLHRFWDEVLEGTGLGPDARMSWNRRTMCVQPNPTPHVTDLTQTEIREAVRLALYELEAAKASKA